MTNYNPYPVRMDPIWVTKGFEQITDISSATGLTSGATNNTYDEAGVVYAFIQVTGNAMRYRTDGTDPTTSVGHYIAQYGTIEVWGQDDLATFRAIEAAATGLLEVTYFGI